MSRVTGYAAHMGRRRPLAHGRPIMLTEKQLERHIDAHLKVWQGWLARVTENGPNDREGAEFLNAAGIRYAQLVQLRSATTEPFYEEKDHRADS